MTDGGAILDRELLLAGITHDLRGALTAVQGWAELADEDTGAALEPVLARMRLLTDAIGDLDGVWREEALGALRVRVRAPLDLLTGAVRALPHGGEALRVEGGVVLWELRDVPETEAAAGWSHGQVRAWMREGGPGHLGARVRIALRMVGGAGHAFRLTSAAACTLTLRLHLA
jgi:hypothetical protein